jgi:hypothetical protein
VATLSKVGAPIDLETVRSEREFTSIITYDGFLRHKDRESQLGWSAEQRKLFIPKNLAGILQNWTADRLEEEAKRMKAVNREWKTWRAFVLDTLGQAQAQLPEN